MKPSIIAIAAALSLVTGVAGATGAAGTAGGAGGAGGAKAGASKVERGKYIVERLGMCGDCHAPRGAKGEFVMEQWLWGAPLGFQSSVPMPRWASVAPPIAGLPGWTDEQAVTFLTTGKDQDGGVADPPMPEYRMSKEDAAAVVAYLRTLKPPPEK